MGNGANQKIQCLCYKSGLVESRLVRCRLPRRLQMLNNQGFRQDQIDDSERPDLADEKIIRIDRGVEKVKRTQ